ncbi:hypothetical protein IPH67_02245 [bacterium]|nr:MAG: hypothetical protein IPH67_02245 [bacterium]
MNVSTLFCVNLITSLRTTAHSCSRFSKRKRIIDYHELDFANFYDQSDLLQMMMTTLENINCDAIIPVFEKYDITAYVIIQKSKPRGEFFDETYKEAVGVFGSYLSGVITNFYHRKRKAFVDEVGLLRQEIFKDKQELKMLKESVKTFLNQQETREVGIFFYRNKLFYPCNYFATTFINIDLNKDHEHEVTKQCKALIQKVTEHKTMITRLIKTEQDSRGVLAMAIPHLDEKHIIMVVAHPNIADVMHKQLLALPSVDEFDYLLHLQSTELGNQLHSFLPINTPRGIVLKVAMLKSILSHKTVFLAANESMHLRLPSSFITQPKRKSLKISIRSIFLNIRTAFSAYKHLRMIHPKAGLLEKLDGCSLFIERVDQLRTEVAEKLVDYIKKGAFCKFYSTEVFQSDVRLFLHSTMEPNDIDMLKDSPLYQICKQSFLPRPI